MKGYYCAGKRRYPSRNWLRQPAIKPPTAIEEPAAAAMKHFAVLEKMLNAMAPREMRG
jgi:hypothetical protein